MIRKLLPGREQRPNSPTPTSPSCAPQLFTVVETTKIRGAWPTPSANPFLLGNLPKMTRKSADQTRTKTSQCWTKVGPKLGQKSAKVGTKVGPKLDQSWDQSWDQKLDQSLRTQEIIDFYMFCNATPRPKLGQIWTKVWTKVGPKFGLAWTKSGTKVGPKLGLNLPKVVIWATVSATELRYAFEPLLVHYVFVSGFSWVSSCGRIC